MGHPAGSVCSDPIVLHPTRPLRVRMGHPADDGGMLSFELVEVNPILDEHNRTAELAVQLLCSAFGKKIF
jgi:arginase